MQIKSEIAVLDKREAGVWCGWPDLNRHSVSYCPLKTACLPISPHPHELRESNKAFLGNAMVFLCPPRAIAFANCLTVATSETVHVGRPPSQRVPLWGTNRCGVRECLRIRFCETPHITNRALPCTHQEEIISSWSSIIIFWFSNAIALLPTSLQTINLS